MVQIVNEFIIALRNVGCNKRSPCNIISCYTRCPCVGQVVGNIVAHRCLQLHRHVIWCALSCVTRCTLCNTLHMCCQGQQSFVLLGTFIFWFAPLNCQCVNSTSIGTKLLVRTIYTYWQNIVHVLQVLVELNCRYVQSTRTGRTLYLLLT